MAQQPAPSGYHYIQCIKVNPGQGAAAHEWITGTDHKVMQALVDSGVYAQGITLQTVMPAGTDAQCDYVFVFFYKGLPHSPITREELNAILRKADIPITAEAIREKHAQLAKLVYNNITQYHALVGGARGRSPGEAANESCFVGVSARGMNAVLLKTESKCDVFV